LGFAQQQLELCEDLLDWVEVGTVGRQEEELGAGGADRDAYGLALMTAEIVHHHDVAWRQGGNQALLDVSHEAIAIYGPVDDAGCGYAVMPQSRQEGECSPSTVRGLTDELLASRPPAPEGSHIGLCPGLINEDQAMRRNPILVFAPLLTPSRDGGSILLACEQRFF
jgi:hypothetical protein